MQDFSLSKVLHNLAISMVLTTSSVNKLHTLYTPGPILTMTITNDHICVRKLGGEAEVLMKLTTLGALPSL